MTVAERGWAWLVLVGLLVAACALLAVTFVSEPPRGVPSAIPRLGARGPSIGARSEVASAVGGSPMPGATKQSERAVLPPDGGVLAALGLVAVPARPGDVEVPAEVRLERARAAVDRFAARVARLEAERDGALRDGADTAALDRGLAVAAHRLEIAQFAQSAIRGEAGGSPR